MKLISSCDRRDTDKNKASKSAKTEFTNGNKKKKDHEIMVYYTPLPYPSFYR